MDEEFKKLHSNLSFEQAVTLFEGRAGFIRQSSKSCSVSWTKFNVRAFVNVCELLHVMNCMFF